MTIREIKSNQIKSNQIKSNQIKSNQIKSNQIKSNQIKSNQIKSNQIKSILISFITMMIINIINININIILLLRGAARGARTHWRPTIRLGILGPDQVSQAEEQHSGHANSTRPFDLPGSSGTPSTKPNLRRGPILQAGQDVGLQKQTSRESS